MSIPPELFIGIAILIGSISCTFFLTKRFYARKPKPILAPTAILVKTAKEILAPVPCNIQSVEPTTDNVWELEVNGDVKFDIKVEWSNGLTDTYSGIAPEIYKMSRPRGVIPVNTSGIAPEWADGGISFQWALNSHHWN